MEERKMVWLAREKNGILFIYQMKPVKMEDHWTCEEVKHIGVMPDGIFEGIRWEDEEPTEIEITIKNKSKWN